MIRFVLASQSPRRQELLKLSGYPFEVVVGDVDESSIALPEPSQNCVETARLKARVVASGVTPQVDERIIVIAADTIVALNEQMLGKPKDAGHAHQMLVALRDRAHEVHTGISIIDLNDGVEVSGSHSAVVTMRPYTNREIMAYLASGSPLDKAGAYGIQDREFHPVSSLQGCYLSVMGLSVCHLLSLLETLDVPVLADFAALEAAHHDFTCPVFGRILHRHGK